MNGPRRNRVAPDSSLIATPCRGRFFGNRGCLHTRDGTIAGEGRLPWAGRRWITCLTRYKDWRRPLTPPGGYTALFFLDEATALAAGHRPCALCRRSAYNAFRDCAGFGEQSADALDLQLHQERIDGRNRRLHGLAWAACPTGAIAETPDGFILILQDHLARWTPTGYRLIGPRPKVGVAAILTPPTAIRALSNGYAVDLHDVNE